MLGWLHVRTHLCTNVARLPMVGSLSHAVMRGEVDGLATLVGGSNAMVNRATAA
jgi:hypothetical protein